MKPTGTTKKGLRYRYYSCYKHIKFKTCRAEKATFPAEPIESHVTNEILKIMRSPEVIMHVNKLAEKRKEVSKTDLMLALKNLNDAWDYLYSAEQRKIANMLINRVGIHADGIKLDMNLDGFDDLLLQLAA